MLSELYVRHFVLIDEMRLQFDQGLHVFTGETGAGKSLILDAMRLVLGGRAVSTSIQRGSDRAVVEAVFVLPAAHPALRLLAEWELDADEGTVVVSRTLYTSGRSTCRVNSRTVTVQMLKALGDLLVEMQGQHESQTMLSGAYQRSLVDLYGKHDHLLREVAQCYRLWQTRVAELEAAQMSERVRAQQMDILRFQIDEIEAAQLEAGEENGLREERQALLAFARTHKHLQQLQYLLEDANSGVLTQLATAEREFAEFADATPELQDVKEMLATARANSEEAAFTLSRYAARIEANPQRLEEIENRLVSLRALMRKYGATTEEILQHLEKCRGEFAQLSAHDEVVEQLRQEVATYETQFLVLAKQLHAARADAAARLTEQVQEKLHRLQMEDARFLIDITFKETQTSEAGADAVTFLFSGNPGEPLQPLEKVASGGELSRTLLALKVVVADLEEIDTLIFDEIDTGVSGEAAERVAEMLRMLGGGRQVLCVTHSPQVAAAGHRHLQIVKEMAAGRAHTRVYTLDEQARRGEVGRLLGAGISDETALKHADALLESFRKDTIASV